MKYSKQVGNEHYYKKKYNTLDRWCSYFYQLDSVLKLVNLIDKQHESISILEIGPGDKTVNAMLKKYKFDVKTMDVAEDINPDYLSGLPVIPLKQKVDIIVCCEVLEHIKYEDAEKSLLKMSKIADFCVVSVPHKSFYFTMNFRFPIIAPIKFLIEIPTPFIVHKFDGQHYWELGTKNYGVARFKNSIVKAGFLCTEDFRVKEFPYHHFFLLAKKK